MNENRKLKNWRPRIFHPFSLRIQRFSYISFFDTTTVAMEVILNKLSALLNECSSLQREVLQLENANDSLELLETLQGMEGAVKKLSIQLKQRTVGNFPVHLKKLEKIPKIRDTRKYDQELLGRTILFTADGGFLSGKNIFALLLSCRQLRIVLLSSCTFIQKHSFRRAKTRLCLQNLILSDSIVPSIRYNIWRSLKEEISTNIGEHQLLPSLKAISVKQRLRNCNSVKLHAEGFHNFLNGNKSDLLSQTESLIVNKCVPTIMSLHKRKAVKSSYCTTFTLANSSEFGFIIGFISTSDGFFKIQNAELVSCNKDVNGSKSRIVCGEYIILRNSTYSNLRQSKLKYFLILKCTQSAFCTFYFLLLCLRNLSWRVCARPLVLTGMTRKGFPRNGCQNAGSESFIVPVFKYFLSVCESFHLVSRLFGFVAATLGNITLQGLDFYACKHLFLPNRVVVLV